MNHSWLAPFFCRQSLRRPALFFFWLGWLAFASSSAAPPVPAPPLAPLSYADDSALGVTHFFPASGAVDVCPDTPLRLSFSEVPVLGSSGKIRIWDADTKAVVATIDVAAPVATKTIGGLDGYNYYSVVVKGTEATLSPKPGTLAYHKSYYVTIDAGAFKQGTRNVPGLELPTAWHFTTRANAPSASATRLVVAADGSGDFCTVQGALDFVPEGNKTPTTLFLRKGVYHEIVFFTNKHAITLLGEDRKETVIAYPNNANFNASGGNPFANHADPSGENPKQGGSVYRRGMFLAHRVNDFHLFNLTMRNTTPHGGSQAEALILNGTTEARAIIKDVDFYSFQDTVQINGQAYIANCHIEGDVDFMWGTGPSFFESCTLRSVRSGAYYTQIRNPATNHGFVYHRCTFEGDTGVTDNFISRIEPHRFPQSEVVLLDCVLGPAVGAVGWQLQSGPKNSPPAVTTEIHFWEYNSRTPAGALVERMQRLAVSRELRQPADALLISDYATPSFVLGHEWDPLRATTAP